MTKQELKAKIDKLENGIKSKATPSNLIAPLKAQKAKLEKELEQMESAEKKAVKTKKVSKVAEKIKAAKKSVAKKTPAKAPAKEERKKDNIARDGDRKSLPSGKRISKSGKVYYETRANRSDKQTSKKPYLADGGSVANSRDLFITNVGVIDNFKLKSLLQKNSNVKTILGTKELDFLNQSNTDVISVSGKNYDFIVTDGENEFEFDLNKKVLKKPLRPARPLIVAHYNNKMADGGEIDWGADLGGGFSVGNDVYITDSKSLFQGKTGFVSGAVGRDLLVTLMDNGNERSVVVSKKGVEKLDAPEYADGGEIEETKEWKKQMIKNNKETIEYLKNKLERAQKIGQSENDIKTIKENIDFHTQIVREYEKELNELKNKDMNYAKGGDVKKHKVVTSKESYANDLLKYADLQNIPASSKMLGNKFIVTFDAIPKAMDSMTQDVKDLVNKMDKGGYMADGGMMDVVNSEISTIRRNIMGTTSFMMKIKGMRNPQDFSVYPISADQAGQPIMIQSATRIGFLDLSSGKGLMSQSHANGAYRHHFTMDKKVPFKISETDLQRLKEHISGTAGSSVGNMGISSDNSGASMMADGGMFEAPIAKYVQNTIKDFYINTYPTDDLGQEINGGATFDGLNKVLDCNIDVYEYLGVGDSIVRERVFEKLAEIEGVNYDVIYDKWLASDYADGGMMADGGEVKRVTDGDDTYYLTYIDSTHFYLSNSKDYKGNAFHIAEFRSRPFYDEVKSWLKSHKGEMMAKGGQVPAHFGSGKNIEVFGYETKNFDICGTAVKEFEAAVDIMKDSKELEKESLAYCAKYVDNLFGIEKVVVEGGIGGELNFSHAVSDIMSASTYNFRAGMAINLYSFVPQHLMEIALRLAKAEKGGLYALGGMTAGRWYKDKSGEEFKFIGKIDSGANKGKFLFSDGQKSVYKDLEEFEGGKPKETKLFGFFEDGGSVAEGNYEMLMSNIKAIKHHAEELADAVKPDTEIEAWVLSKSERAETDLSDITHYLDGLKMEKGGYMADGGEVHEYYDIFGRVDGDGYALYSINGNDDEDILIGYYKTMEDAKNAAKEIGLERRPMYMRYAKGGELEFKNSNLYLNGFGMDSNGNSVVKVSFPNQRAFSIQTNGVLNETNSLYTKKIGELTEAEIKTIEKEVVEYVKQFGSKEQKQRLKTYSGYMAKGGGVEKFNEGDKFYDTQEQRLVEIKNVRKDGVIEFHSITEDNDFFFTEPLIKKVLNSGVWFKISDELGMASKVEKFNKGDKFYDTQEQRLVEIKNVRKDGVIEFHSITEDNDFYLSNSLLKKGLNSGVWFKILDELGMGLKAKGGYMAKGGKVPNTYIPNKDVKELMVVLKNKSLNLKGSDILDGVYAKNSALKTFKKSKSISSIDEIYEAIVSRLGDEKDDIESVKKEDIKRLVDVGYDLKDIELMYFGVNILSPKIDVDYGNSGLLGLTQEGINNNIERLVEAAKNKSYEIGLKYPEFDWSSIIKKYKISKDGKQVNGEERDFGSEKEYYVYTIFEGNKVVVGTSTDRVRFKNGKKLPQDSYYQKDAQELANFEGGYWGLVTSSKEVMYDILEMILSQKGKYVKDLNLFVNRLGGIGYEELDKNNIKYAKGGEVRYKLAGNNFGQQIESGKKFAELIKKAHENQTSEHKYPENFIKEIAYTGKIVKNDGTYFLKDYSYKGVLDRFEFLGDKYFLESLKYLNRPTIKNFKFEDGGMMAKGGFVSKGELVWKKLTNAKKMEFLKENFTPEITPRSQETLVGKDYNFLPKNVKIKFEAKYANVEDYAMGGKVKFADKVKSVQASLLKRKKVAPQVQKDYGKTYSKAEAKESAQRIVGSRMAQLKEKMAKKKK